MNYPVQDLEQSLLELLTYQPLKDVAHDVGHLKRVLNNARWIALEEKSNILPDVVTAAALLHDLVSFPKNSPSRSQASKFSADGALELLSNLRVDMSQHDLDSIHHAILAHSFSANIAPQTALAKIIQDSDRIDALGAIGIARCFAVSGSLGRALFDPQDPLASNRQLDESKWALDHFQTKLLKLPQTMQTNSGRILAEQRASILRNFMLAIRQECTTNRFEEDLNLNLNTY